MSLLDIIYKIVIPGLYVIGLVVIYFHQKSKIGNLKGDFDRAIDLLTVYDPDKIRTYSTMGAEKVRFDYEKKELDKQKAEVKDMMEEHARLQGELRATTQSQVESLKQNEDDYTLLLIDLMFPLTETKYLDNSIAELPEREVKKIALFLRKRLREKSKERGVTNPLRFLRESHPEAELVLPPEDK